LKKLQKKSKRKIIVNDFFSSNIKKEIKKPKFTFIDFCAGIGTGRLGLENLGLSCVGFSEIDKYSEYTYRRFFINGEKNLI
jgi:hypothetical protein